MFISSKKMMSLLFFKYKMLALFIGIVFATDKMNQEAWKAVHYNKNLLHHIYDKMGQSNLMYLLEKTCTC